MVPPLPPPPPPPPPPFRKILYETCIVFLSQEQWEVFTSWQHFDSTEDNFCEVDGESSYELGIKYHGAVCLGWKYAL